MPALRSRLEAERAPARRWLIPVGTVMLGSLVTIVPFVAPGAILPPFGLMMLLAWRLLRPDALKLWAAAPLGAFDDLLSGQPFGSAIMLWTVCLIVVDLMDLRLVGRDFRQDWLIAAGGIAFALIAGRVLASPIGAHVDRMMVLQIIVSILLYPLAARLCARLDSVRAKP